MKASILLLSTIYPYCLLLINSYTLCNDCPVFKNIRYKIYTSSDQTAHHFTSFRNCIRSSRVFSNIKNEKSSLESVDYKNYLNISPIIEYSRFKYYIQLRKTLQSLLLQEGCVSRRGWIRNFERWQFNSKLLEKSIVNSDPLLPSTELAGANNEFLIDLMKLDNMTESKSTKVAAQLAAESIKYARQIRLISNKLSQTLNNDLTSHPPSKYQVRVNRNNQSNEISLSLEHSPVAGKDYFIVKTDRVESLKARWMQAKLKDIQIITNISSINETSNNLMNTKNITATTTASTTANQEDKLAMMTLFYEDKNRRKLFYDDLYCLLVRYAALEGPGLQAALPSPFFLCIQSLFDVSIECFSSPLNYHLPQYCSVFPDIDTQFSSLGNFFDFYPSNGSFQANPPFVASIMSSCLLHMETLLAAATGPMSFLLIVPAWEEETFWKNMMTSKYLTYSMIIPASEHCYCDGAQHRVGRKHRPAPFASGIIFLQNLAGKEVWTMSPEKEHLIRESLKAVQPDEVFVKRQASQGGLYIPKTKKREAMTAIER